jgi:hypothetical protein
MCFDILLVISSGRQVILCQTAHDFMNESSKIAPLGARLFQTARFHAIPPISLIVRHTSIKAVTDSLQNCGLEWMIVAAQMESN